MSTIEIVALRPFTTVNTAGERVERTLVSYREEQGPMKSKTLPGTIREREAAERAIRGE